MSEDTTEEYAGYLTLSMEVQDGAQMSLSLDGVAAPKRSFFIVNCDGRPEYDGIWMGCRIASPIEPSIAQAGPRFGGPPAIGYIEIQENAEPRPRDRDGITQTSDQAIHATITVDDDTMDRMWPMVAQIGQSSRGLEIRIVAISRMTKPRETDLLLAVGIVPGPPAITLNDLDLSKRLFLPVVELGFRQTIEKRAKSNVD